MRLNSKEKSSLTKRLLDYKKRNEPESIQRLQRGAVRSFRNTATTLASLPSNNFEILRMPHAALIKQEASKEIEKLLTLKTRDELGYGKYIRTMEGLGKLTEERTSQNREGNYFVPFSGHLFPENESGLPLIINPKLKILASKAEWLKSPGENQPVFLRLYFDLMNNGKPEKMSTDFYTGISKVAETTAEGISAEEINQSLKTALAYKLSEIFDYRSENSDTLAENGFLIQDFGRLPYINGFLANAEFKLIHDSSDKDTFLLKANIPFQDEQGQSVIYEVNFNLKLKNNNFEIVETV